MNKPTKAVNQDVEFVGVCKRCGRVVSDDQCTPCGLVGVTVAVRTDSLRSIEVVKANNSEEG
jgi:hypothetical protein